MILICFILTIDGNHWPNWMSQLLLVSVISLTSFVRDLCNNNNSSFRMICKRTSSQRAVKLHIADLIKNDRRPNYVEVLLMVAINLRTVWPLSGKINATGTCIHVRAKQFWAVSEHLIVSRFVWFASASNYIPEYMQCLLNTLSQGVNVQTHPSQKLSLRRR